MKRNIYIVTIITTAMCLFVNSATAKKSLGDIIYSNLQIHYNSKTGNIDLTFEGKLHEPDINYCIMISPKFVKDSRESYPANFKPVQLPSYAMEGEWYNLSRFRKKRSGINTVIAENPVYIPYTNNYTYRVSIPQKDWVDEVSLTVYTSLITYSGIVDRLVFRFPNLLTLKPDDDELYDTNNSAIPATSRSFVERINDTNRDIVAGTASPEMIEDYIEKHGEGSLTIYFEVGSSRINPDFMWNRQLLRELMDVVSEMKDSNNDPRIVVVGYSSPEGSPDINKRLSTERAWSVQEYITLNSKLMLSNIATYDGGVNWLGLKRLVASDNSIPMKNEILSVLEQPVWNARTQTGRLSSLMRLGGGEPYRYMLNNYFPQLRGAAFIKVFYKGKN